MVVAAGVPPAVEGGHPAARTGATRLYSLGIMGCFIPPGGTPRLYGRRDARRHIRITTFVTSAALVPNGTEWPSRKVEEFLYLQQSGWRDSNTTGL